MRSSVPAGQLMVAWHEVPGRRPQTRIRPGGTVRLNIAALETDLFPQPQSAFWRSARTYRIIGVTLDHTVPHGTGHNLAKFQALRARLLSICPSGTEKLRFSTVC